MLANTAKAMNSNLHASSMSPRRLRLMFHPLSVLELRFSILFQKRNCMTKQSSKAAKATHCTNGCPAKIRSKSCGRLNNSIAWIHWKAQERRPHTCLQWGSFNGQSRALLCNIFASVCIVGIYNMNLAFSSGKRQKKHCVPLGRGARHQ